MFREKLKMLREGEELSQAKFAKAMGFSQSSIASWENGTREPGINTLIKIAQYFNTSVDYLVGLPTTTIKTEKSAPLPQDEQEFLTMYRALPSYLKDSIFSELKGMYKAYLASKSEKTTRRA